MPPETHPGTSTYIGGGGGWSAAGWRSSGSRVHSPRVLEIFGLLDRPRDRGSDGWIERPPEGCFKGV